MEAEALTVRVGATLTGPTAPPPPNPPKSHLCKSGRKFGTGLKEHKTEVEATNKPFTRSQSHLCKSSHNYHKEFCTHSPRLLPSLVCPSDKPASFLTSVN